MDEKSENTKKQLEIDENVKIAHLEWISALDMLEDPIFIYDKNFRILRCNHSYRQKAGIPYSQIIGQHYYEIFPKTNAPIPNCSSDIKKNTEKGCYETLQVGDLTYYSRAYIVKDKDGNYLYSVHTLEDITIQVEIQNALKTSEAQYRRLFEVAKDGILILDGKTGAIIDANPFILNLTAYTLDEITGKNLWEIGLISDIAQSKISFEKLQSNDYVRYDDLPLQTKDGQLVDVEFVSNIYLIGEQKIIQCNIRDITDRIKILKALQASESQYRRLFEAAKDGILILDAETGLIVDANPFILNLTAYTLDEITGKNLWEIGFISDIAQSKISFEKLQNNDYVRYKDLPIKTKDGQLVDVEFISSVYLVNDKRIIQCNIRDISEQLKSRKLLQESEEKFRTITTNAQDAIIIMNDEGKITYWNEAATYIFGYKKDEVMGRGLHTLLAPERFFEAYTKGFSKFKKTGKGFAVGKTLELSALRKDGTEFPIELSLSANMKDGRWEAIGIIRDISKRKEDEAGLKMFRALLDHSSDAIEVLDATTLQLVDINETACRTLGYTRDELLSMNIRDIDLNINESTLKDITEVLKNKGSTVFESTHRRKDGSAFPVEISLSLVKTDKEYRVAIVRDITESYLMKKRLAHNEKKYSLTFSNANIGISHISLDRKWIEVNSHLCNTLGYSEAELIGMSVQDITYADDIEEELEYVSQLLDNKIQSYQMEKRYIHKNKSLVWVQLSVSLIRDEEQKPQYFISVIQDISQIKAMIKELHEKEELMIVQSRHAAMGEMIGMIAHQWRQPITAIAMGANNIIVSAALETLDEENLNELAQEIIDQTNYLSKTIDDFRNFFKPNKEREEIQISSILNDTLSLMGKSFENNNIAIALEINCPTAIQTYSSELLQVFINILKNSKEVLIERNIENPKISISATEDEKNIIINICDNGGGIEPKVMKRIFEPYFTTKDEKTGTGLGLYMSETIVNKHLHGSLNAKNSEQGVCFIIILPKVWDGEVDE